MDEQYKFFAPIQVRYIETDMQGHVFFGHYFTYFDFGATEYLKAVGYSYNDFLNDGFDFFYVKADCQYRDRAFFEEVLHVHTRVGKIGNTSFTFEFGIFEEASNRPIASGQIVAVTIDKETRKPVPVPERFRNAVAGFESNG